LFFVQVGPGLQGYNRQSCQETVGFVAERIVGDMSFTEISRKLKNIFSSGPLPAAVLAFLLCNLLFIYFNPFGKVDPDALPVARNWIWWATHEYSDAPNAPDVVVLGSSVVMHPLWHHEADFRQQTVDLVADHRSKYLEHVISSKAPLPLKNITVFNFGLPGSMASDDYMVSKALFTEEHKPALVVLGLCPRDMFDNRFNNAASSKHFQYLSRYTETRHLLDLSMPEWWQRIGYLSSEALYFSSKATAAQVFTEEAVKAVFSPLTSKLPPSPLDRKSEEDKRFAMYQNLVEKGFWIAKPNAPFMFMNDTGDLKKRFKNANNKLFENQRKWLEMCLQDCREKGIKVVLVNMPNTLIARSTMPSGVYERHVACLQGLANKFDCTYVDVDKPGVYGERDFTDWCHLSADGGKKAFGLIGEAIASNMQLVTCLSERSVQVAAKQAKGRGM
jgi:hypothetical protein